METAIQTALWDLTKAIEGITLGSIESVVITAAGTELIQNWNDHNDLADQIDVSAELAEWELKRKGK